MIERRFTTVLLLVATIAASGCVSFSGPNDVRRMIAEQEQVELDQDFGVTVGPVGVFLASTLAGPYLPLDIRGVQWVSYGEYQARPKHPYGAPLNLRHLDLPGWERVVRVCEQDEDVLVMVQENATKLRKILVVVRDDDQVHIARVEGNLETILDRILESDLVDDEIMMVLGGGSDGVRVEAEATVPIETGGDEDASQEAVWLALAQLGQLGPP
jgi:hypothetical protein